MTNRKLKDIKSFHLSIINAVTRAILEKIKQCFDSCHDRIKTIQVVKLVMKSTDTTNDLFSEKGIRIMFVIICDLCFVSIKIGGGGTQNERECI